MPGKIILTADDYGASEFIDSGILKAIAEMRINAVGCFVTFPGSREQIQKLLNLKRSMRNKIDPTTGQPFELGIGLHFSMTAGQPVSALPADCVMLNNSGGFRDAEGYPFHDVDPIQFVNELQAQLDRLQDWLGESEVIDFISNHHGLVYMDDSIYGHYLSVAQRPGFEIPVRTPLSWIRTDLRFKAPILPAVIVEGLKLGYLRHLGHMKKPDIMNRRTRMQNAGIKSSYCFTDTIYGNGRKIVLEHLLSQYRNRTMVTEFMMHLGDPDVDPGENKPGINGAYFKGRKKEFSSLMNLNLDELLAQYGVSRVTFRALEASDSGDPS